MTAISRAAKFAERTAHLRASTIREMLKVTQQPDVISFGGGLPAPELFPTLAIANATRAVMERVGAAALQYSVTEGIPEMRAWVANRLASRFGRPFDAESVTIVNGSQQGLDLVGKILLDPGDHVVLEDPSYLGAIQAFDAYQARYLTAATDEDGLLPESLERVLERADPFPKFLYLVPNFRIRPAGRSRRNAARPWFGSANASVCRSSKTIRTANCDSKVTICRRSFPTRAKRRSCTRAPEARSWRRACGSPGSLPTTKRFGKRSCSQSKAPISTAEVSRNTSFTNMPATTTPSTATCGASRRRTRAAEVSWPTRSHGICPKAYASRVRRAECFSG